MRFVYEPPFAAALGYFVLAALVTTGFGFFDGRLAPRY